MKHRIQLQIWSIPTESFRKIISRTWKAKTILIQIRRNSNTGMTKMKKIISKTHNLNPAHLINIKDHLNYSWKKSFKKNNIKIKTNKTDYISKHKPIQKNKLINHFIILYFHFISFPNFSPKIKVISIEKIIIFI